MENKSHGLNCFDFLCLCMDSKILLFTSFCWCNYLHNILPNINYQPGFVIKRVDALYVPITDRFLCLMSIVQSRKPYKNQYSVFTLQR
jgi:hypothetical protein